MQLTTADTAARLGVSPSTLREWTMTFDFPTSTIEDGRRRFDSQEVLAFAAALTRTLSVSTAIAEVRASPTGRRGRRGAHSSARS